ncbi:MAG: dihydrodipicolinate synthase family protein [Clostridia bacterium]|nr:dihydrodipicolinate synthase family protein [Clostridia bacterium]
MTRHEQALEILKKGTVIPATPLALDKNRKMSEKGLRLLMNYYLNSGVGGIATAVHTTQFEIRDPEIALFEPILKIVSEEIDKFEKETGKVIVKVAGVCGPTEQAVAEARLAKKYGYDAVLLSPGGLNHLPEDELIERTKQVAKEMPVIGFYLQTSVGGRVFTYDYWKQICAIDNVVAIKCASFNRYTTLDVVRAATFSKRAEDITLYTGNDDNIVIDLLTKYSFQKDGKTYTRSFEGGLLGHWSVWTYNVVNMFNMLKDAKKTGVTDKLLTLAAQVTDANSAFFDTANGFKGCIAGLHEVLRRQGLMENIYCLNPEETMSEGQAEELDRVYKMYPHLNDDVFIKENLSVWKEKAGF